MSVAKFDETKMDGEINNETEQPNTQIRQNISEIELKSILSAPAVFVSRFYMAAHDASVVRIVFADESADKKHMEPRFAVLMTMAAFLQFSQLIQNTSNQVMQNIMRNNPNMMPLNSPAQSSPDKEKLD